MQKRVYASACARMFLFLCVCVRLCVFLSIEMKTFHLKLF